MCLPIATEIIADGLPILADRQLADDDIFAYSTSCRL